MHSVTRTIFPVFAFKVTHRVILLTRFCKLHCISQSRHTVWGGGHVPQVPQWHDASACIESIVGETYWTRDLTIACPTCTLTSRLASRKNASTGDTDWTVSSFQQNLRGGIDTTGNRSYPPWNHPNPRPGDTGTELSAVDSRPTFISNIHHSNEGLTHFHHCDKSPFSLSLAGGGSADSLYISLNWRHCHWTYPMMLLLCFSRSCSRTICIQTHRATCLRCRLKSGSPAGTLRPCSYV